MASIADHVDPVRGSGRQRPSARSATTSAIPITTASLANSDGWIDMLPSSSHDRDPLMVDPIVSTSTSPTTDAR